MSLGSGARPPGTVGRRPRSTARDIERYGSLFARRTHVMKSSAMRDLMALTERDDVISLAGGMPDTGTFPADSYASLMSTVAAESTDPENNSLLPRAMAARSSAGGEGTN